MSTQELISVFEALPPAKQQEVSLFVSKLAHPQQPKNSYIKEHFPSLEDEAYFKNMPKTGLLKLAGTWTGKISLPKWFDDDLEDMKDYM